MNASASGAGGLGSIPGLAKSHTVVANGSPQQQHFHVSGCVAEMSSAKTRSTTRCITQV